MDKNRTISAGMLLMMCIAALTACTAQGGTASETTQTTTVAATITEQQTETSTETTEVTTTEITEEITTEVSYPEFEDTPENAYERLNTYFNSTGEGLPDTYAGSYSYFGKLYVCITTEEPPDFCEILDGYTCTEYRRVSHSFNYLEQTADEAAYLVDNVFKVTDSYADVPSNKAVVVVENADPKDVRTYLETQQLSFELSELTIIVEQQ